MAALSDLLAYIDSAKRTVGKRLSDLYNNPSDYLDMVAANVPEATQKFIDDPSNFIGGGLGKIVWHGSPHKFTKFDMSKIGTGEGAQAYGHGLYMAEAPDVAKEYQRTLAGPQLTNQQIIEQITYARNKALQSKDPKVAKAYEDSVNDLIEISKRGGEQGHLYKVDIPDEAVARFLDWDKPLSEQAPEVQRLLSGEFLDRFSKDRASSWAWAYPDSGKGLYASARATAKTDDEASKYLKKLGIPGIRYLDEGSRSAGQGTSNFVLFDDQLPRILETNGVSTGNQPWAPGEWNKLRDLLAH